MQQSIQSRRSRLSDLQFNWSVVLLPAVLFVIGTFAAPACAQSEPAEALPGPVVKQAVETVTLELSANGFYPAELTLKAGRYFLNVRNVTPLERIDLELVREKGETLRERVLQPISKKHMDEVVVLPAGTFLVRVKGRPEWTARIAITN